MRTVLFGAALLAIAAAFPGCKSGPDPDVSKQKQVEQIVKVDAIQNVSAKFRVQVPETFKEARAIGFTFASAEGVLGPTIKLRLDIESSAPKDAVEALRYNDQSQLVYAKRDLPDGFAVTNTPNKGDTNYYTYSVRKVAGLPTLPSGTKLALSCEVVYPGARTLKREKEIVAWMEGICTDATLVP